MKYLFIFILLQFLIFYNCDLQAQWVQTNESNGATVMCFAISGTNIFAGTNGGGVYLSTDNGGNWTSVGPASKYVRSLAVSGTNIFAGTSPDGVYLSTNNGTSWINVSNDMTSTQVFSLAISGTNIFAGTFGGGVFLSTNNGTNWTQVNNGLTNTDVYSITFSGTNIFAGTDDGAFLSTNNGTNWTQVGLTTFRVQSLAVSGTNIFAGTWGDGVCLSTNNGTNWNQVGLTTENIFSLIFSGTNLFAGGGLGVYLSTDNGTNWTQVNNGLPSSTSAFSLTISGTNIFAGTGGAGVWMRPISEIGQAVVTLKALIQGFYNGTTMVPDTVTLELHNASSPYALVESQRGVLSSSGVGTFGFNTTVNGTPYYLVIKHRNAVETWSATGQSFLSNALSYDFTTTQSQAFGSNLIQKGSKWCLYSGDVSHDGQVSFTDLIAVDNDNTSFVTGYTATDLTGDNQVTFSDLIIVDNNNTSFITKVVPTRVPNAIKVNGPVKIRTLLQQQ